jgi:hypothetical protein
VQAALDHATDGLAPIGAASAPAGTGGDGVPWWALTAALFALAGAAAIAARRHVAATRIRAFPEA